MKNRKQTLEYLYSEANSKLIHIFFKYYILKFLDLENTENTLISIETFLHPKGVEVRVFSYNTTILVTFFPHKIPSNQFYKFALICVK